MKKIKKPNPKIFNDWVAENIDDYESRFEIYYGGAGSGKSFGAVQKVITKCLRDKRYVLVVRKVDNTIRHSIYKLFKSVLESASIPFGENKSEMTLVFGPFNSTIIFKGLQDRERIKSIADLTDIVIEEATELTEDDFEQLNLRLRPPASIKYPQMYLMFNPVSKANWCYKHWFENGTPPKTKIIHSTYLDNKFLTEDYVETLNHLKYTNPPYYKIYCLGHFATLDKLVFPIIEKRLISDEEVKGLKFVVGMDFGYTQDPTAIIWSYVDLKNKIIYIKGEYGKTGMTNDVIAEVIKDLGLAKERIIADGAEPKSIAELRKMGIARVKGAKKGPDSIMNGIDRILRYKIVVDERCTQTIEEFENYTWQKDKKTDEYINKPIDEFCHFLDGLRYSLEDVLVSGNLSGGKF